MATTTDTQTPALHAADSHDLIRVHGARVNNLRDVSVEIPKRRLTVFTGVSGSGKSSLVFGTIAAESQRLINETYSAFVQGFMPTLARPDVDVLEGLTTAIIVDQQRLGVDPRSTVGTATDANALLRILFSRIGKPYIGPPSAFAFNVPSVKAAGAITVERGSKTRTVRETFTRLGGMCPRCEGRGSVSDVDLTQLYDESKSLNEGAIMDMPSLFPGTGTAQAKRILQQRDAAMATVAEVQMVLGKIGRAETATDAAPMSMIETVAVLRPEEEWRPGMTQEDVEAAAGSRVTSAVRQAARLPPG